MEVQLTLIYNAQQSPSSTPTNLMGRVKTIWELKPSFVKSPCTIGETGSHGIECEDSNEPSFNETSEMSFKPVTKTASWIMKEINPV